MISHMDTCQLKWKKLLEGKRNQSDEATEENISKAFDFTFNKMSKKINPNEMRPSHMKLFYRHDMFKALVSVSIQSWDLHPQHNSLFFSLVSALGKQCAV